MFQCRLKYANLGKMISDVRNNVSTGIVFEEIVVKILSINVAVS